MTFTLPISATRHSSYLGEGRASLVPTAMPKMCAKTALTASSKVQPTFDSCSHNTPSFSIFPWIPDVPNSVKLGTKIQKAGRYFTYASKQSASFAAPISVAPRILCCITRRLPIPTVTQIIVSWHTHALT